MHLYRQMKIQLAVFVVIAIIAISVLAIGYGHALSSVFGVGRYGVTVNLSQSGGLNERANVTYRGVDVGRVDAVRLTTTGVSVSLSLNTRFDIPSDVDAAVHSQSVVGEQFIELVPRDTTSRALRDGDVISVDRTSVPPDLNKLLNDTNTALNSIPNDNLKTVIDESYTAVGGLGPELSRIVDGSSNLARDARSNLAELTNLIDISQPILDSQIKSSDAVTAWASHLASITGQLMSEDRSVSSLIRRGGPAAREAQQLLDRVNPTVPILLANLVSIDDVALVYQADIEQLLVLFPQGLQVLAGATMANLDTKQDFRGVYQDSSNNLNLPPPCLTGYLPPSQWRSPVFEDYPDRPAGDIYCRIPQDSFINVRGARNIPCEGKPWKRAPTVAICESDQDYVPLNNGFNWKGDPNATSTGQPVPQLMPSSPVSLPSPDGRPPVDSAAAALAFSDYNPADGTYIGSDGQVYTQTNLARHSSPPTWQSMLTPTAGP